MFHYQLNQNIGCKVKSVVNMNRQPKRLSNRRRRSEQPFYLPQVYPWVTPPMMPGQLSASYPEFTPGLEGSKTLFSLNPGVTRESWVGLPLSYPLIQKPDTTVQMECMHTAENCKCTYKYLRKWNEQFSW